jgi:hypothetical protein
MRGDERNERYEGTSFSRADLSILLIVQKVIIIMHFAVEAILFFLPESVSVLSCILLPHHNLCLSKIISFRNDKNSSPN